MDIGVFSVTPSAAADPAIIAKRAEELGFESYWVPDHPIVPVGSEQTYPGTPPDGSSLTFLTRIPDPLIVLARAGAVTTRLKLGTGVYLVPERHPLISAQQIASLDEATRGRFLLGIGAGWNRAECEVLGGNFDHRWGQTKDFIAAMRSLWQDDEAEYRGKYAEFSPVYCYPKPARQSGPPVLVGGIGSPYVYRRVAEWGDGWIPLIADMTAFHDGMEKLKRACEAVGRDMDTVDITVFGGPGQWRKGEELAELERGGANRVTLWINAFETEAMLGDLDSLASQVL